MENKKQSKLSSLFWGLKLLFKFSPIGTRILILVTAINGLQAIVVAYLIGRLIDKLISIGNSPESISEVIPLLLIFLLIQLLFAMCSVLNNSLEMYLSDKIPQDMRRHLFEALGKFSISELEDPAINNKITRIKENIRTPLYLLANFNIIIASLILIIIASARLSLNFWLAIPILVISILPRIFINKYYLSKLWVTNKKFTVKRRKSDNVAAMLMDPKDMKEINLIGGFNYLGNIYKNFYQKYYSVILNTRLKWVAASFAARVINYVAIAFIFYIFLKKVLSAEITPGEFAFTYALITELNGTISGMISAFTNVYEMIFKVEEIREIIEYPTKINSKLEILNSKSPTPTLPRGRMKEGDFQTPSIKLENLSFHYQNSDRKVLDNINLEIKSGEKIAIVGENGAGKTTLVKLIAGIYAPSQGEIKVNDDILNSSEVESWQKNLGLLFQDYNTYGDLTVWENIALGNANSQELVKENIDFEKIIDAAKKADAYEFIQNYPKQFDQILSEKYKGGIRPSTGQWQKIAIARFFYRNSPVLILDEPTASIDAVAEAAIFDRIYEFIQNKTVIIISHRFSTVRNADRIIVLDKGKIIEEGTHTELLARDGKYANAFRLQAKGYGS